MSRLHYLNPVTTEFKSMYPYGVNLFDADGEKYTDVVEAWPDVGVIVQMIRKPDGSYVRSPDGKGFVCRKFSIPGPLILIPRDNPAEALD